MKARKNIIWQAIKCFFLAAFFALLLLMLNLSLRGFPEAAVRGVEQKLKSDSFVVRIDAIKLNIFEGLTATDVRFYRRRDIGSPLAEVERVVVGLRPVRRIIAGQDLLEARIRKGVIRLSTSDAVAGSLGGAAHPRPMMMLRNVDAVLNYDPRSQLLIAEEFSMDFMGLNVTGKGAFVIPHAEKDERPAAGEPAASRATAVMVNGRLVTDILGKFKKMISENVINVEVDFLLDLQDSRNHQFDVRVESRGEMKVSSHSRVGTCVIRISCRGGKGVGMLVARDHLFSGVWLHEAMGEFDFDAKALSFQKLDAVVGRSGMSGPLGLAGVYDFDTGNYSGRISCGFNPHALSSPLEARGSHGAKVINDFEFTRDPPRFDGEFTGVVGPDWRLSLNGKAHAGEFSYRGAFMDRVDTDLALDLSAAGRTLRLSRLKVKMGDRAAEAELNFDFLAETVAFKGVSEADPSEVARMIGPFMTSLVGRFRIEDYMKVEAFGIAGYRDQGKNDISISVEGRQFGWHRFLCDDGSLRVLVSGDAVNVSEIRGSAYGGTFEADVAISLAQDSSSNMGYKLNASVDAMDFGLAMRAIAGGGANVYKGECSASVELEGRAGEGQGKTVVGKGTINVSEGHIFQIPLFGELSSFIIEYVPGLSLLLRQTDAKASVVIRNGFVSSDRILVEGDVFSLEGSGSCSLAGALDFDARFVLFRQHTFVGGLMRYVMLPVSKMLEFRLSGTFKDPRWRPVFLPKELFFMFGRDDE